MQVKRGQSDGIAFEACTHACVQNADEIHRKIEPIFTSFQQMNAV